MRHYHDSEDRYFVSRLRRNSAHAARRMLIWMVFVLTFTVITSVVAMFEFVKSGTAGPVIPADQWALDIAQFSANFEQSGWSGLKATGIHD